MTRPRCFRGIAHTVVLALALVASCNRGRRGESGGEISRNWTPAKPAGIEGVPTAEVAAAIALQLKGQPPAEVSEDQWKHTRRLYDAFHGVPLWLTTDGLNDDRVKPLLRSLAAADSDALRLDLYPLGALGAALQAVRGKDKATAAQLAEADVLSSVVFVAFAENMMTGQVPPASLGQSWHIGTLEPRLDSAIALTLQSDALDEGLARMRPQDANYEALRQVLQQYRQLAAAGGWSTVPAGRMLKRGDRESAARINALRARLRVEGLAPDSAAPADTSSARAVFDAGLARAVGQFQARHGINVDSMLGAETVTAMNVPVEYRLSQIAANLERYRWMPRSFGSRYILVNVPEFMLAAYDGGEKKLEMKVIVGQEYENKATPVFSDSMEYVVFRPYWNVTDAIAQKELWPKVSADPGFLERGNYEIYNDHGTQRIRQRPGEKNALGLVKFMFPNDFNIYLHDTPNGELFAKDIRAFSHGCIRVEKPTELAEFALGWPEDRVVAAEHGGDNRTVQLRQKIPVYIAYFTTIVKNGALYFGNDLYDRDNQLIEQVAAGGHPSAEAVRVAGVLKELGK
jgi:murein L,D-transpeptidase YcbB/YkuD